MSNNNDKSIEKLKAMLKHTSESDGKTNNSSYQKIPEPIDPQENIDIKTQDHNTQNHTTSHLKNNTRLTLLYEKIFSLQALYIFLIVVATIILIYFTLSPKKQIVTTDPTLLNDFSVKTIPDHIHTAKEKVDQENNNILPNPELLIINNKLTDEESEDNLEKKEKSEDNKENTNELGLPNKASTNLNNISIPSEIIDDTLDDKVFSSMIVVNNPTSNDVEENNPQNTSIVSNILKYQHKGNLSKVISQGTIIKGYLTSAINTDFGGNMIQAIISDNVYAAGGYNRILIPKGSKILGQFNTNFSEISRLIIQWYRIDLPNGQVISITESPSVDELLRNGAYAKINRKHLSLLKSISVLSALNLGLAFGADKMDKWMSNYQSPRISQSLNTTLTQLEELKRKKTTSSTRITEILNQNLSKNMRDQIDNTNIDNAIADVDKIINNQRENRTTKAITSTQEEFSNVLRQIFKKINPIPCATIKQGDLVNIYIMSDLLLPTQKE